MQDQKERIGTTNYTLNSIGNMKKIRHNRTQTVPRHKNNPIYDISLNQDLNISSQLPKKLGFSTQLNPISTKTYSNSFKLMEFGIKTGGIKVDNHFENRIRPIKSNVRQTKSSIASSRQEKQGQKQDINFNLKKPLNFNRQKSSILDKNNLYLVPFLKNKVKRLTRYLDKTKNTSGFDFGNSSLSLRATPVEYNFKEIPMRSTSLFMSKRYSGIRTHKNNTNQIRL